MSFFGGLPTFFAKTVYPTVSNTYDLGSTTKFFRTIHARQNKLFNPAGSAIGILEARSDSNIYLGALTTDGGDSQSLFLSGGAEPSSTRGAYIEAHGNEYSGSGGTLALAAGAVANAHMSFLTNISSANLRFRPDNPTGGKGFDVLGSNGFINYQGTSFGIVAATSDGADNSQLQLGGGGGNGTIDRGGGLTLYGNESAGAGAFTLFTGELAGTWGSINCKDHLRFTMGGGAETSRLYQNKFIFSPISGTEFSIASNTNDGSDTFFLSLCGGGSTSTNRGASLVLYGLDHGSVGLVELRSGDSAQIRYYAGGTGTGSHVFYGANNQLFDIDSNGNLNLNPTNGGNVVIGRVGKGLQIKEGTNARMGTAVLVAGTVTVSNTSVTASTRIFLSRTTTGGTTGHLSTTVVASTSFTINSSNALDTSTVAWLLVEPAA